MNKQMTIIAVALAIAGVAPAQGPPCAARADAVIANSGTVISLEHSLVDSYHSALGAYWGSNTGANGNVRAGGAIIRHGGTIRGAETQNSPAGLAVVPVPSGARPLPLGATVPGRVRIHNKHESITLRPGNYVAADIDLDSHGEINVYPAGVVNIFVTGRLSLDGDANLNGDPRILRFLVTSAREVHLGRHGTLAGLIYAPKSEVELRGTVFGSVVGSSVKLGEGSAVHYDESAVCAAPPPTTTSAVAPPPLPAPPPPVVGCYVNTRNGWQSTPCATKAFIDANFPHPDTQLTLTAAAPATALVWGQLATTIPQVASENNAFLASTASISPLCQSTGAPIPNQWSIQSNTNQWSVASGTNAGNTAATQFVIQSNGSNSAICIWNVDVSTNDYSNTKCVPGGASQRSGGLQAFDYGNIAAFANSNGTLTLVADLSWVPNGQPTQYSVVSADTYGLAGAWSQVSGGLLGLGSCSQAQLANAEVATQIATSTCPGDTQTLSPVCAPPTLQPNASVFIGSTGTVETNNLTAIGTPSLSYPNTDLAVTNITATTSGTCLGPSLAYVKDSPADFGSTPSTLGDQVFWESPDIFLVPHGTPVDLTAVSTETTITPGGVFDIWVRLHNDLGCSNVTGAKALVYLADPAALSVQWSSITGGLYVGNNSSSTGVTVPAGGQALIGPLTFTAPSSGIGNGHKCLLAAIEADGEPPPANTTDAPDSNQVAQRNLQFASPCVYPLTNGTSSNGSAQITLSVTPNTGTVPSLTALPDVEVTFDDADSSWFNVWNSQTGNGTTFAVTHSGATNSTDVRLGAFSVALNTAPLAASQTRNATGVINPAGGTLTLQIGATLSETGPGGQVLVANGGSCVATAPVIQ